MEEKQEEVEGGDEKRRSRRRPVEGKQDEGGGGGGISIPSLASTPGDSSDRSHNHPGPRWHAVIGSISDIQERSAPIIGSRWFKTNLGSSEHPPLSTPLPSSLYLTTLPSFSTPSDPTYIITIPSASISAFFSSLHACLLSLSFKFFLTLLLSSLLLYVLSSPASLSFVPLPFKLLIYIFPYLRPPTSIYSSLFTYLPTFLFLSKPSLYPLKFPLLSSLPSYLFTMLSNFLILAF